MWGVNFTSVAYALESFSPWSLRIITFVGGAGILAAIAVFRGVSLRVGRVHDALHLAAAGTFSIAGFGALSALALLYAPVGRASICVYLMPIWVAALSKIALRERLGRTRSFAALIGICGLAILLYPLVFSGLSHGALAATGAGFSWAIGTVYLKWARVPLHPLTVTVWQLVTGAIVSVIGAILWRETLPLEVTANAWWGLGYTTIIGTAFAYLIWFSIVTRLPASTAGLGTLLVPVFGVLSAIVIVGERPTTSDFIGFTLILVAGLLALPPRVITRTA